MPIAPRLPALCWATFLVVSLLRAELPEFVCSPQDDRVVVGHAVKFKALMTSSLPEGATAQWFHGEMPVTASVGQVTIGDESTLVLRNVRPQDEGQWRVRLRRENLLPTGAKQVEESWSEPAWLAVLPAPQPVGSVDIDFRDGVANGRMEVVYALQPLDQGWLVGGIFESWGGQPCSGLIRLDEWGEPQPFSTLGAVKISSSGERSAGEIKGLAQVTLPTGAKRWWVVGQFAQWNGSACQGIVRIDEEGKIDTSFRIPSTIAIGDTSVREVRCVLPLSPTGPVLVGGAFKAINGEPRPGLALLNADGSLNAWRPDMIDRFRPGTQWSNTRFLGFDGEDVLAGGIGWLIRFRKDTLARDTGFQLNRQEILINGTVWAAARIGPNILVGGELTYPLSDGTIAYGMALINGSTGGLTEISPGQRWAPDTNDIVYSFTPDGPESLLIGGDFSRMLGRTQRALVKLDISTGVPSRTTSDGGSINFEPPLFNEAVRCVALDAQNRILVGGRFSQPHQSLVRLVRNSSGQPSVPLAPTHRIETGRFASFAWPLTLDRPSAWSWSVSQDHIFFQQSNRSDLWLPQLSPGRYSIFALSDQGTGTTELTVQPRAVGLPPSTVVTAEVELEIPDALSVQSPGELTHSLFVPEPTVIGNLRIMVDIRHNDTNDLSIQVTSPRGTVIPLAYLSGRRGRHFDHTVFATNATRRLSESASPYRGPHQPDTIPGIDTSLATVIGESAQGDWIIQVKDYYTGNNLGRLVSWGLEIEEPRQPMNFQRWAALNEIDPLTSADQWMTYATALSPGGYPQLQLSSSGEIIAHCWTTTSDVAYFWEKSDDLKNWLPTLATELPVLSNIRATGKETMTLLPTSPRALAYRLRATRR